jgi:small GTP-binding protein
MCQNLEKKLKICQDPEIKFEKPRNLEIKFKIVMAGCTGVGKSALLRNYNGEKFSTTMTATHGMDVIIKSLYLKNQLINLHLWDTAGQEHYKAIRCNYYRQANGIILVYDIYDYASFEDLEYWLQEIYCYLPQDIPIVMLGNKIDMENEQRKVSMVQAQLFANKYNFPYFEVSAKTGHLINEAIETLVFLMYERLKKLNKNLKKDGDTINSNNNITINNTKKDEKSSCCN